MRRQKEDILKFERVLAAIDLGDETEKILAYAVWLAGNSGQSTSACLDLLYVLDYGLTPPAYLMPYLENEKKLDEAEMEKWEKRIGGLSFNAGHTVAAGRLLETFSRVVRESKADFMVLGHKSHLVRPSSSERLIRFLDVPMLVVRGRKSEGMALDSLRVRRILCALDFSDNSRKALELAVSLAERSSSELIVVHAAPDIEKEKILRRKEEINGQHIKNYREDVQLDAETRLCAFLKWCDSSHTVVRMGVPHEIINEIADEKEADLIIVGARGLSYIKGVLLGSVSESVIRSAPCPVVIVR